MVQLLKFEPLMAWSGIRFELLELLGEGAQGRVYKALRHDRGSGLRQFVALKILHSETAVNLWRQEFESLAKVNSPYCVRVLSFERYRGRPALVLEFVEGASLARLGQSCWLSREDVQEIVAQLEHALRDLHRHGVFHGDMSPQNVMVDREGHVRLLDFGLANAGTRVTPGFAAPERMNGESSSRASDLYSLGKIENFLLGREKDASPYLHCDPALRNFQDLSPCRERQRLLRIKIVSLLERQRLVGSAKTQTQIGPQRQKTWRFKATVLASITALMVMLNSSAGQAMRHSPPAVLKIRTQKWHYFLLNGSPLGYSPVSLPVEPGRRLHLQWISEKGRGEADIQIKPRETLELQDNDFSQ